MICSEREWDHFVVIRPISTSRGNYGLLVRNFCALTIVISYDTTLFIHVTMSYLSIRLYVLRKIYKNNLTYNLCARLQTRVYLMLDDRKTRGRSVMRIIYRRLDIGANRDLSIRRRIRAVSIGWERT